MARIRSRFGQAAATHRRAAALATTAEAVLTGYVPKPRLPAEQDALYTLAQRLADIAGRLAPGWLSAPLAGPAPPPPRAEQAAPGFVRIGAGQLPGVGEFPVIVPWRHITFDAAGDDPRVPAALQALLLRVLAAAPPGSLQVRVVDPRGSVTGPFTPLRDAGLLPPPITDAAGLSAALAQPPTGRHEVLVIAGWPAGCGPAQAQQLAELAAQTGAPHLLVGQWPAPAAGDTPLPGATRITLHASHAGVGHPPGGSFAAGTPPGVEPSAGLNAEVILDSAPAGWIAQACAELAGAAANAARASLGDLVPDGPIWTEDASDGLAFPVARAAGPPITLHFRNPTWHWLVGGRPRSGKTTLLHSIVYSLASRYPPDQLAVYLLDPTGSHNLHDLATLPQVRATGLGNANRVRATLHEVAAQAGRRPGPTRTLCVLDGLDRLQDSQAHDLLASLAASRPRGVHLLLAVQERPPETLAALCRLRIALPGAQVLDPANDAAGGIVLGTAIVNTASGLGGPRGATRAHEQLVRFPDPGADPLALRNLQHRLAGERS